MSDQTAALQARYDEIHRRTAGTADFSHDELEKSRRLFDLTLPDLPTRSFDVLTCLVGLPIPDSLRCALGKILDQVVDVLPRRTRVYRVRPELLHWEVHVIKRPHEPSPLLPMEEMATSFRRAVQSVAAFEITYAGFFVSPEGTICCQGFGDADALRRRLRVALPFSSPQRSELCHVSIARILDPVGPAAFRRLLQLRESSEGARSGVLPVREVKLVSERRWYMEDHEVVHEAFLRS